MYNEAYKTILTIVNSDKIEGSLIFLKSGKISAKPKNMGVTKRIHFSSLAELIEFIDL